MSEALTATLDLTLSAPLTNPNALSTPSDGLFLEILQAFNSGTGAGNVNHLWYSGPRTLGGSANETIDLSSPPSGSSQPDSLGQTLAFTKVKILIIQILTGTTGLTVGGDGTAAAWTSPFNGSGTNTDTINSLGAKMWLDPGLGYAVASGSNAKLKIANNGGASLTYAIFVVGSTA